MFRLQKVIRNQVLEPALRHITTAKQIKQTKMKKKMGEGWTGRFEDRVVSWKGLRLYTQMG